MTLLYNNVLDRQPDSAGMAAWTESMNSGKPRADVVVEFSNRPSTRSCALPISTTGSCCMATRIPLPSR